MSLILSDGERAQDLHQGDFQLIEWDSPLVSPENTYAESSDSQGRRRIRTRALNPEGAATVMIHTSDTEVLYARMDELQELVASAHRRKGTLTYTPREGQSVGFDLESIHLTELPQKHIGVRVWLFAELAFEVRPYGRLAPVEIASELALDGPVDSFDVEDVPGHVDAHGDLTLTDTSTERRDHVEVGVESTHYDPLAPSPLFIGPDDFELGAGSQANPGDPIEATLVTSPLFVCSTGPQPHIGRWRVKVGVEVSAENTYVKLVWRRGDGSWDRTARWQRVPSTVDLYELDWLIDVREVEDGTHSWEGRVEAYAAEVGDEIAVHHVIPFPAERYSKAHSAGAADSPSQVVAVDTFANVSNGDLDGQTPQLAPAGDWARVAGDTDDFQGVASLGLVKRGASNDSNIVTGFPGVFNRLGTGTASEIDLRVDVSLDALASGNGPFIRGGAFVRYVDASNWLACFIEHGFSPSGGAARTMMRLRKCVAGTVTGPHAFLINGHNPGWRIVRVTADEDGNVRAYRGVEGGSPNTLTLAIDEDADLATAGALESGGYGLFDASAETLPATERRYDNISVAASVPPPTAVVFPGRSARFTHEAAFRQSADGVNWGSVPTFAGQHLYLPPATRSGRVSRIAVLTRQLDISAGLPSKGLDDAATADLSVTPRVLLTGDTGAAPPVVPPSSPEDEVILL